MDLKLTYLFGLLTLTSFTKATAGENDIVIDQDLLDFLNAANIEYSNPPSSSPPPRKISGFWITALMWTMHSPKRKIMERLIFLMGQRLTKITESGIK